MKRFWIYLFGNTVELRKRVTRGHTFLRKKRLKKILLTDSSATLTSGHLQSKYSKICIEKVKWISDFYYSKIL